MKRNSKYLDKNIGDKLGRKLVHCVLLLSGDGWVQILNGFGVDLLEVLSCVVEPHSVHLSNENITGVVQKGGVSCVEEGKRERLF